MLHFTPQYRPSKGSYKVDKWEGDIGVSSYFALFARDAVVWST